MSRKEENTTRSGDGAQVRNAIQLIEDLQKDGKLSVQVADTAIKALGRFSDPVVAMRATTNWMEHGGMHIPVELAGLCVQKVSAATMAAGG